MNAISASPAGASQHHLFRRYAVLLFFVLSFGIAWTWWGGVALLAPQASVALVVPGAWAPTLAALLITWRLEGRVGVGRLLRHVLRWRVGLVWYGIAIVGPLLVALLALAIHALLGGTTPTLTQVAARFGLGGQQAVLVLPMLPLIYLVTLLSGGPLAEELGWRGFAQARLQQRLGPTRAGLVIGLLWGLWHLPLFFIAPAATSNIPLGWFIPLVTAWGVLFAGLYARTGNSVLLSMLLHAGVNFVVGALGLFTFAGSERPLTVFVALMWAAAIAVWHLDKTRVPSA